MGVGVNIPVDAKTEAPLPVSPDDAKTEASLSEVFTASSLTPTEPNKGEWKPMSNISCLSVSDKSRAPLCWNATTEMR